MYSGFFRKAGAAAMAAAMAFTGSVAGLANVFTTAAADSLVFEFEDAKITGDVTVESGAGASGGSYLKMTESGTIELSFTVAEAGTYNLVFYAGGIGTAKQQNLALNGTSLDTLAIPESDGFEAITMPSVKLKAGENIVTITKSWGWSTFDKLEVLPFEYPAITASQPVPTDPKATAETKSLMAYLNSVYGKNIISGQQEIYQYGPHGLETEFEYLYDLTGHYPAIRGFDYGNRCCELFGAADDGTNSRIIDWVKTKGGIATASFHLNVPKDFASYTGGQLPFDQTTYSAKIDNQPATDFITANAYKEGTKEYDYYRAALERLAGDFLALQEEGIPVIWRPLHEAEGGGGETGSWFWWGKEGSEVYKNLWVYTYKTLTEDFGCHNLIWEWNSYNFDTSANWYPGDEYVDIIGYDKYNCTKYLEENNWQPKVVHDDSAIASTFYGIMEKYGSTKMVAMAENDCFSTVDNLVNDKAGWLYFCTWYDGGSADINFLSDPRFNTQEDTIAMYQSDYCITLDELPADLYTTDAPDVSTTSRSTTTTTTTVTEPITTTTHEDDPNKSFAEITTNSTGKMTITFEEPAETVYLRVDLPDGVTYANGGLGVSVPVDGKYYWANIMWEAKKSGDIPVVLADDILNITEDTVEVEDEAVVDAVKAALAKQKTFEVQIWYASDASGKETKKNGIVISAAYTMKGTSDLLYGDANCDTEVNMADAVMIMQSITNPDKYQLSELGTKQADVDGSADITNKDALLIQQLKLNIISEFPITSNK